MPTTPKIDTATLAAQYGWSLAILNSDPGLKKLFNDAVKHGYTEPQFTAKLRNTSWYKKHGEAARQTLILQKTDPKEFQRRSEQMKMHIRTLYGEMSGGAVGTAWLKSATSQAMMLGWTDEELRHHIATDTNYKKLIASDHLGGQAGQAELQLKKLAGDYGLNVSNDWLAGRVRNMMIGTESVESATNYMVGYAKAKYRAFADEIDKGATVRDIAEPYMQSMSKLLELNPEAIGLHDTTIQKALTGVDPNNGRPVAKPLWQFENDLRRDARWTKTQNAQDSMMNVGHQLLQQFGLVS